MGSIWIALSWSAAVLPAWLILSTIRPRLEGSGPAVELLAFGGLWYLCGGILSQVTRLVLGMLGVPIGGSGDPTAEIAEAERQLAAGRIPKAEGQLRIAACRLALGQAEAALSACRSAEAAGAGSSHREQLRFLIGRSLEGLGRRAEAADVYRGIVRESAMPKLFRVAARLRLVGVTDNGGDGLLAELAELTAEPGCKPCSRVGRDSGWSSSERDFLREMFAEAVQSASAGGAGLSAEQADAVRGWIDG